MLVTQVSHAKTAELIKILFGWRADTCGVNPRNHVLDQGPYRHHLANTIEWLPKDEQTDFKCHRTVWKLWHSWMSAGYNSRRGVNNSTEYNSIHLWCMLGNLADQRGCVLFHVLIGIFETREDTREYVGFHDHLRQIHIVLRYLTQCRKHLSLSNEHTTNSISQY